MHYLKQLSQYLLVLGIPGLFLFALLDSAAIPMVGGPDTFIILLSWQRPALAIWIALAAATGSTIGCLILYRLARAAGQVALARIAPEKRAWVQERVDRNASWAVFLAVTLPPPFPTKPFILAAGACRAPLLPFTLAAFAGRMIRYTALAYLGARFGDRTAQVIRSQYPSILLGLAGVAGILLTVYLLRRRRRDG